MKGSCVCGAIEFEVTEIPNMVFNCHCTRCRKSHGAAFATQAFAIRDSLKFIRGEAESWRCRLTSRQTFQEEVLKEYESTGGIRTFCSHCGSRLMNYAKDNGDYLSIALSCIDTPHNLKPVAEVCISSKVDWHDLCDQLPHYDELPPI
ncbi:MAG: GFA family protein [Microcoleaceae cyanobacterium]